ncbi:MAG: hypothetical protein MJ217_02830 [Bacilli bacterium]|nr:hypothetical protein [Bacilli bacterium]
MNIYLIGAVVAVIFFATCAISTNNLIIAGIVALVCFIYFAFFASPQINKYTSKLKSFKDANQFINNFIVSLSIQPVIDVAIDHSLSILDDGFKENLTGIEQLSGIEKLKYLCNCFPFHFYSLFVDIVTLWQEQGGDILKMSNFLINDMRQTSEYVSTVEQMNTKKTIEFSMLWVFSLAVLIVIRFALSQFYSLIINKPVFIAGVIILFVFIIFSFQILISKITSLEIKGGSNDGE